MAHQFKKGFLSESDAAELTRLSRMADAMRMMHGQPPALVQWNQNVPIVQVVPDGGMPIKVTSYSSSGPASGVYDWVQQDYNASGHRYDTFSGTIGSGGYNPLYETNQRVVGSNLFPYYAESRHRVQVSGRGDAFEFDFVQPQGAASSGGGISGIIANTYSGYEQTGGAGGGLLVSGVIRAIAVPEKSLVIYQTSGGSASGTYVGQLGYAGNLVAGFIGAFSGHQYLGLGTKELVAGGVIIRSDGVDNNGSGVPALSVAGTQNIVGDVFPYTAISVNPPGVAIGWGNTLDVGGPIAPLRVGYQFKAGAFSIPPSIETESYLLVGTYGSGSTGPAGTSLVSRDNGQVGVSGEFGAFSICPGDPIGGTPGLPHCKIVTGSVFSGSSLEADFSGYGYFTYFAIDGSLTGAGLRRFAYAVYDSDFVDFGVKYGVSMPEPRPGMKIVGGIIVTPGSGSFAAPLGSGIAGSGSFLPESILSSDIASGTIQSTNLGDGVVLSGNIGAGQIGTPHIANDSIITTLIASGQVTSSQMADNSVYSGNIATGQVGTPHLASESVTDTILGSGSVGIWKVLQSLFRGQSGILIELDTGTGEIVIGRDS